MPDPRPLKTSIAGTRGEAGTALTAELAVRLAAAFGTYLGDLGRPPRVLLARDTRPSGPMLAAAVRAALTACGCEVFDLGICPTPVLQHRTRVTDCDGGVVISAGHGPEQWNALKFAGPDGVFLDQYQGAELLDHFHHHRPRWVDHTRLGAARPASDQALDEALAAHRRAVLERIDADAVAARRYRVAVDLANGACCRAGPLLLRALGCEVMPINDDPSLPFPHPPEPTPATMSQVRALVLAGRADVGFCHDADGDRLGVVTERGEALGAGYTLALAAEAVLPRRPGVVVTNLSTSRLVDHAAARHGGAVIRTRVGQSYIAEAVHVHHAVLGGEGSGGVMYPELGLCHDSLATIAHLLDWLARDSRPLSARVDELPRYVWREVRVPVPTGEAAHRLAELRDWAEAQSELHALDVTEGVRIEWRDAWLHVRSSITEPAIRVVGEGDDATAIEARLAAALQALRD